MSGTVFFGDVPDGHGGRSDLYRRSGRQLRRGLEYSGHTNSSAQYLAETAACGGKAFHCFGKAPKPEKFAYSLRKYTLPLEKQGRILYNSNVYLVYKSQSVRRLCREENFYDFC